jgi:pyridoxine 4-dehydrogenase
VTSHPTVTRIAEEASITPSQVGLAWLLTHQSNILFILGTATPKHLDENVESASITLSQEALAELDKLCADVR